MAAIAYTGVYHSLHSLLFVLCRMAIASHSLCRFHRLTSLGTVHKNHMRPVTYRDPQQRKIRITIQIRIISVLLSNCNKRKHITKSQYQNLALIPIPRLSKTSPARFEVQSRSPVSAASKSASSKSASSFPSVRGRFPANALPDNAISISHDI